MTQAIIDQIKTMPTSKLALILSNIELARTNVAYLSKAQSHLVRKTGNENDVARRIAEATAELEEKVKAEIEARARGKGRC